MLIPRLFHRIWVGGPMPDELEQYVEGWLALHPAWEHRLWDEQAIATLGPLANQGLYDAAPDLWPNNVGQARADILRLEVLWRFGGVYVDVDFEARKPIDPLLEQVTAFAVWERDDVWAANGLMGACAGHSFIGLLVDGLAASAESHRGKRPNVALGPQYLTRTWRALQPDGFTIFPASLFIPYAYDELKRSGEDFPDAYAVHHWHNQRRLKGRPLPRPALSP